MRGISWGWRMNRFRTLRADEIECRIAMVREKGVSVLLYKTARTDADLLDETVGPENWQNDFQLIDGVLFGKLGVDYGSGLVWKMDAGTESNTEQEKGRASDAFKRAGFKHGIGRELYSAPFIWIPARRLKKLDGNKCYDSFTVASIGYSDTRKINHLIITNQDGEIVFEMGEAPPGDLMCQDCGRPITADKRRDGSPWSAKSISEYTFAATGRYLCKACGQADMKRQRLEAEKYAHREDGVE